MDDGFLKGIPVLVRKVNAAVDDLATSKFRAKYPDAKAQYPRCH